MTTIANPEPVLKGNISTVPAPTCLLCEREGAMVYVGMSDWLWGVPGEWGVRRCECGLAWLDPQPSPEDVPKLYARYYTHSAAGIRTPSAEEVTLSGCSILTQQSIEAPCRHWWTMLEARLGSVRVDPQSISWMIPNDFKPGAVDTSISSWGGHYFNASAAGFFRKHAALPVLPIWISCTLRVGKRALRADWKRAGAVLASLLSKEDDLKHAGGACATEPERPNG